MFKVSLVSLELKYKDRKIMTTSIKSMQLQQATF